MEIFFKLTHQVLSSYVYIINNNHYTDDQPLYLARGLPKTTFYGISCHENMFFIQKLFTYVYQSTVKTKIFKTMKLLQFCQQYLNIYLDT